MGNIYGISSSENAVIKNKIIVSVFLSLSFIVVYGFCNWLSSIRSGVGVINYNWERHIPLIPILIVPYMSIDLFFLCAPFLCRNEAELKVFSRRIIASIIIAGTFFLIMPMKFGFPRPQVEGVFGFIFEFLHVFDQPYNLIPSLHIIFCTILAEIYARHTRGVLKFCILIWFLLVGISTLFTHQHHLLDILGGLITALVIIYIVPFTSENVQYKENLRIAYYFALLAISFAGLSMYKHPWGFIFLWPAFTFLIISAGYWKIGPSIFRKNNGEIPWIVRIILAPYFIGQEVYLISYHKKCNPWDEVVPGLIIGRKLNNQESHELIKHNVNAVIDMTTEFSETKPLRRKRYLNLETLDLSAPSQANLSQAVKFIEKEIKNGKIYVHCKIGYSRSAAIVGAYLIHIGKATTVENAIDIMKSARPSLIVRPEIVEALEHFRKTI